MKYALIGCGMICANHIRAALETGLEIVALCDLVEENREKALALIPEVFLIWSVDPWPISTMAITAAMPMMMPRMVRAARMGLRTRALIQVLRRGRNFIRRPC